MRSQGRNETRDAGARNAPLQLDESRQLWIASRNGNPISMKNQSPRFTHNTHNNYIDVIPLRIVIPLRVVIPSEVRRQPNEVEGPCVPEPFHEPGRISKGCPVQAPLGRGFSRILIHPKPATRTTPNNSPPENKTTPSAKNVPPQTPAPAARPHEKSKTHPQNPRRPVKTNKCRQPQCFPIAAQELPMQRKRQGPKRNNRQHRKTSLCPKQFPIKRTQLLQVFLPSQPRRHLRAGNQNNEVPRPRQPQVYVE